VADNEEDADELAGMFAAPSAPERSGSELAEQIIARNRS
jgi:hypothetical protein